MRPRRVVSISTRTAISREALDIDLSSEEVDVERVAIGKIVETTPQIGTEGDVTVFPVLEEQLGSGPINLASTAKSNRFRNRPRTATSRHYEI